MALLSDMDWLIILAVGAFLLVGKGDPQLLRTVGRWYGKVMHLKQELLSEVTRAADVPELAGGRPVSIRSTLLGLNETERASSQAPIAVARPPVAVAMASFASHTPTPAMTWVNSLGPQQWSVVTTRLPEFDGGVR
jgi:Sec-independent protein translocase protein TatA